MASLLPKLLTVVGTRRMPLVGAPLGSKEARQNSISVSAACDQMLSWSVFWRRKSAFRMSSWDWIWASEMFWVLLA